MSPTIDLLGEYVNVRQAAHSQSLALTPYRGYRNRPRVERYKSRVEEINVVRAVVDDALRYAALLLVICILALLGAAAL